MIYTGQSAIDYLSTKIHESDPGSSSHWQKYHSAFNFTGDGFKGLEGFGGCSSSPRWVKIISAPIVAVQVSKNGKELPIF